MKIWIQRILVFILIGVCISIWSILFFWALKNPTVLPIISHTDTPYDGREPEPEGIPIDIADVLYPLKLKTESHGDLFFDDSGLKRQVTYLHNPIRQLSFSRVRDRFGYFVKYNIYDENIPDDREVVLRIENLNTRTSKEVFSGSFRTSGWEWFSDNEVLVSESCGTECQAQFLINITSGKKYTLQYGVGYTWSPDKNWVFAYNYSYRTGITVGDKFGDIKLRHHISPTENETANTPLAVWSPDSSKLALIMEKSDNKGFELSVFDVHKKFKDIFQSDLDYTKKFELEWISDSGSVLINGMKITVGSN